MARIQNLFDLSGRVSVITGGATGLGLQMAHALAEAGSNIVRASSRTARPRRTLSKSSA